ncbi:ArsR/SmtB family transcription factor [Amycolatopsis sp. WGS_07]|uniref:ArsR/SmtB family transcription factor n=1 Tax=Amycolatopsis sp. WGS_07 TaxID=3076764 RepID=UPI0038738A5A
MNTRLGKLRMRFTPTDLLNTRVRATPDPLWELALSVHKLKDVTEGAGRWSDEIRAARRVIADLIPPRGNFADFLTPTPRSEHVADGMETIASTPRQQLFDDLHPERLGRPTTEYARALATGDRHALGLLMRSLERYFHAVIEPRWPLIRRMTTAHHGGGWQRVVESGLGAVLGSLSPAIRWNWPWLETDYPLDREIDLGGRGLTLVPSYFCDGVPVTLIDTALEPVLVFPVRAAPTALPDPERTQARLAPVLGRTRARILVQLAGPHTTSALAAAVGMSLATVSQQVGLLRQAGFVTSVRDGRTVMHTLSPHGRDVVDADTFAPDGRL